VTPLLAVAAGLLGAGVAVPLNRAAGGFPWQDGVLGRPAVRPPLVEVGTGVLFALTALRFGLSWELPAFLYLAAVAVLLGVVDLQHRLLPNKVVLPSQPIGALLLLLPTVIERAWGDGLRAVIAAMVLYVLYTVLRFVSPRGLGGGDVKLAALLGLYLGWLGWGPVVVGMVAGFAVQSVLALVLLATRRVGLRSELPFGPAMLLGAAVAVGWADSIVRAYLGVSGAS
jgi:leader peptidase (prepilin peptidase)/N-methyltransferase